jgi:hypothetical protein
MDAEEIPTHPEMLGPCPRCRGEGMVLSGIELAADGTLEHALASPCEVCGDGTRPGSGQLTAAQLARWNATKSGRPRPPRGG